MKTKINKTLRKQFCSFKMSVALQELGFEEECLAYYNKKKKLHSNSIKVLNCEIEDVIEAPLLQQVTKWFLDKRNLPSSVNFGGENEKLTFFYEIRFGCEQYIISSNFKTYEKALLKCIKNLMLIE